MTSSDDLKTLSDEYRRWIETVKEAEKAVIEESLKKRAELTKSLTVPSGPMAN
jgi:hypothetical protein